MTPVDCLVKHELATGVFCDETVEQAASSYTAAVRIV